MKISKTLQAGAAIGLFIGLMAAGVAPLQAITINTSLVGDPGNPDDTWGYGGVAYTYAIGTTEVNLAQYTAFLNAVAATDTYGLYNTDMLSVEQISGITRSGSSGTYTYAVSGPLGITPAGADSPGDRPVTYVSWFDAARFANWMANGQPTGAQNNSTTEDGAYSLFGATSGLGFTKNATNPNTGLATTWWIPSEDEWYKAAYYDPSATGPADDYWTYPTRSDSTPDNDIGATANQANWRSSLGGPNAIYSVTGQFGLPADNQNYLTNGGAYSGSASYYGTFDQAGNVEEWSDGLFASLGRVKRGGDWGTAGSSGMASYDREYQIPTWESDVVGFRVATVPEPSTGLLLLIGTAALMIRRRRWISAVPFSDV